MKVTFVTPWELINHLETGSACVLVCERKRQGFTNLLLRSFFYRVRAKVILSLWDQFSYFGKFFFTDWRKLSFSQLFHNAHQQYQTKSPPVGMQMIQKLRSTQFGASLPYDTVAVSVTWCFFQSHTHRRGVSLSVLDTRTNDSILSDPSLPSGENCVSRSIILTILFVCRNQRSLLKTALKRTWSVSPCSSSQQLSLSCGKVHTFIPTLPHTSGQSVPMFFRFVKGSEKMKLNRVWVEYWPSLFFCVHWHLGAIVFYKVTSLRR